MIPWCRRTLTALALALWLVPPVRGQTRVILLVADGAGVGHWTIGAHSIGNLAVQEFPVVGLVDTRGDHHVVTESAAAATAYATGVQTFPGGVGVGPDSQPRQTVLEAAKDRGMATGLVTTTLLTDATPAAFASHSARRSHAAIGRQMARAGVDVLLGGGRIVFEQVLDGDSIPLLQTMQSRYTYVTSAEDLKGLRLNRVRALLGLFADQNMDLGFARTPSLADMARAAIEVLQQNPRGFFLLVENEETDTQAHDNQPYEVIAAEMVAFDDAVHVALDYQKRNPETLLVVVGDHETGGLALQRDSTGAVVTAYTTEGHTAALVPVFARGPRSERFAGIITNSRLGELLHAAVRR
ncbi:MAG TPA: alkaline phosphatase [Gemmatimonadales bacterium]|nr:alkaline phosphatase [Gemmatimonadales bacterium]